MLSNALVIPRPSTRGSKRYRLCRRRRRRCLRQWLPQNGKRIEWDDRQRRLLRSGSRAHSPTHDNRPGWRTRSARGQHTSDAMVDEADEGWEGVVSMTWCGMLSRQCWCQQSAELFRSVIFDYCTQKTTVENVNGRPVESGKHCIPTRFRPSRFNPRRVQG